MSYRLCLPSKENSKGSYSLRVETRTIDKDQGRSSLHSSLLEIFKIVKAGVRWSLRWSHHAWPFFLEWMMLTREGSFRECFLGEVNTRCTAQFWLEGNHLRSAIKKEKQLWECCSLLQTGTWGLESTKRKREKREKAISLGLRGKPIKPIHRTCTTHEGTGRPLKEVRKPGWESELSRFPCSEEVAGDRKKDAGDPSL